jgi:hypothetical protein
LSIFKALKDLGVASRRARTRDLLQPFIIEMALARLDAPLSIAEQYIVLRAVGDRSKVNWPDWWEVR